LRADSTATLTAQALYNADTTNNNGTVLSFRTDTTGTGASTFYEGAGIAMTATEHNHATRNFDLGFFTDSASSPGAYRMLIKGTGNVGIGTTNPAARLDVNGSLKTTNNFRNVLSIPVGGDPRWSTGSNKHFLTFP
jgi:hypothetical protein